MHSNHVFCSAFLFFLHYNAIFNSLCFHATHLLLHSLSLSTYITLYERALYFLYIVYILFLLLYIFFFILHMCACILFSINTLSSFSSNHLWEITLNQLLHSGNVENPEWRRSSSRGMTPIEHLFIYYKYKAENYVRKRK